MQYVLRGLSGRLGNKLLQHLDAFSVAEAENIQLVSTDQDCRPFLKRTYLAPHSLLPRMKRKWQLSEVLFSDSRVDIDKYFHTASSHFETTPSYMAIHFRGTDFAQWKAHSIIGPDFFLKFFEAKELNPEVLVVTDDPQHPYLAMIKSGLTKLGINVFISSGNALSDFVALMSSKHIVASPSTYSLTAAVLGGQRITYPKEYAAIEKMAGSQFWADVVNGKKSPYVTIDLL